MSTAELKTSIRLHKDAGHSKVAVPLNVLEQLIRDAEKWRNAGIPEQTQPPKSFGNVINGRF